MPDSQGEKSDTIKIGLLEDSAAMDLALARAAAHGARIAYLEGSLDTILFTTKVLAFLFGFFFTLWYMERGPGVAE